MTGLYLHIPFCVQKCHYCNFVITTDRSLARREEFSLALEKEAAHYKERFRDSRFDTFYIGGGTPSTLLPEEMRRIFSIIHRNFKIKESAEISLEINPGDMNEEKAECYRELGVNRVSIGTQSFQDRTLKRVNRDHGALEIRRAFQIFRKVGFKNISLDLILSLPDESIEDVRFSLKEAMDLSPEHISLYELTIEDKTVFGHEFKKGALRLPDEDTQLEMLKLAREFLKQNGYVHYELLSYARSGFESRHNRVYWANEEYLGLGPGAFSYFDGRRFRSSAHVDDYLRKMSRADWTAFEEEVLNPREKEVESFLLALRLSQGADISQFPYVQNEFKPTLLDLEERGLLTTKDRVQLTPKGQLFAEHVFAELSSPC